MNQPKYVSFPILVATLAVVATDAAAAVITYSTAVLADNPLVYYQFDETSSTTAANSGSGGAAYNGTINTIGGSVTLNQESFTQGGGGGDFLGSAPASALTSSLTEWSVEAWVNYDSAKTLMKS